MNGIFALIMCLLTIGNIMNGVSNVSLNNQITVIKEKVQLLECKNTSCKD